MTGGHGAGTVVIDAFPDSVQRYRDDHAIVAVDVIRATTMAMTAVAQGRRCLVAGTVDEAFALRGRWSDALLAGELAGDPPDGFDLNNSPSLLAQRTDTDRPLVMLSSSGTVLMREAARSRHGAYVACFRNVRAVARHLAGRHPRVAVIGAGSRGTFREEDQMGCAWVAGHLIAAGYDATADTRNVVARWAGAPPSACLDGDSVRYLRRTGQVEDIDFTMDHVDDLDVVGVLTDGDVVEVSAE